MLTYNGRPIEIEQVSGQYEDDIMIESAYYTDVEFGLIEDVDVLDAIANKYPEVLYELWFDNKIIEADFLMDSYKDGTY